MEFYKGTYCFPFLVRSRIYAACQAVRSEKLIDELKFEMKNTTRLLIDNKSAIDLARHPICHGKSKHIETCFHFLHEQVNK